MHRFEQAIALKTGVAGHVGQIAPGWDIAGNADGGYLMALLGRAALLESGRRDAISLSAQFLSPGKAADRNVSTTFHGADRTTPTPLQRSSIQISPSGGCQRSR